jgi:hypothetical protein
MAHLMERKGLVMLMRPLSLLPALARVRRCACPVAARPLRPARSSSWHPCEASSRWGLEPDPLVAQWSAQHGARGTIEEPGSTEEAMVDDLRGARALIEDRLRGHPVRHLCLPYTIGSPSAVQAARRAGYSTCFWGVLPDRRTNRPGQDPYYCPRLKADYLLRLPGHGRRSLGAILSDKLRRRLSGGPVY